MSVLPEAHRLSSRRDRGQTLDLSAWSDCSGINSEMLATGKLAIQLRALAGFVVKWISYATCDKDKMSRRFCGLNQDPSHAINQVQHRNFEVCQY